LHRQGVEPTFARSTMRVTNRATTTALAASRSRHDRRRRSDMTATRRSTVVSEQIHASTRAPFRDPR
jgi:hypothetical protein